MRNVLTVICLDRQLKIFGWMDHQQMPAWDQSPHPGFSNFAYNLNPLTSQSGGKSGGQDISEIDVGLSF